MSKRLFKTMAAVLAIAAAAAGPVRGQNSNVSWVLTPYGDLQDGDTVVIVDKTSERAMTNNNGSFSAPSAVQIELSGDQNAVTEEPAATLQWVVERDNGNYMFKVPGTSNYLYCTSDNDGVRVGSGNKSFEFQNGGTYNVPFLKNNATSRYLGLTNAYLWRCPSSISGSSIKDNVISFYKKTVVIIPTYTVRMAEGTEEAANWSLASGGESVTGTGVLENVMSGSEVTATYNGTRKVKSVKAVKYVPPAVITWNSTNVFNIAHENEELDSWSPNPRTYEGITISGSELDYSYFRAYDGVAQTGKLSCRGDEGESFTFTAPSGKKFCKIEIINDEWSIGFDEYGDWTQPEDNKVVWSGTAASTVTLGTVFTSASNLNSIVFTLIDAQ